MIYRAYSYLLLFGFWGFYSAVTSKLFGFDKIFKVEASGLRFPFYLRACTSDIDVYKQIFIKNDYCLNVCREPEVIIDAGANIGLAAIFFANMFENAKIVCIEPESSNFEILCKNTEPYDNIYPLKAALWNKNEDISLVDPGLGEWGFMTGNAEEYLSRIPNEFEKVKGVTLDKVLDRYNLKKVDILKIDIEGSEKEVFSDCSLWLDKVDSIIIELHERLKPGANRCFYLATDGFSSEWKLGENIYLTKGLLSK